MVVKSISTVSEAVDHLRGEVDRLAVVPLGWQSDEVATNIFLLACGVLNCLFAARSAMLRMFFLRAGQKTMAARMAVEYSGELWELKIGYDEKFSACSPGIVLTHETLRWACEHGLTAHRFLGSAEPWQRWWSLELRHYQSVRLYPFSVPGSVALLRDASQLATGRLRESSMRRLTPLLSHLPALGQATGRAKSYVLATRRKPARGRGTETL
jgi:CelD/BcsL family acetyltransferase involved in cellulose biosynthesis